MVDNCTPGRTPGTLDIKKVQYHEFIAKMQASYVSEAKENLGPNECLVFADF